MDQDSDPLGHPDWSNKEIRRPSIDGQECGLGDTGTSEVINTSDLFQIKLQGWQYEPEEISINRDPTNIDNVIVIGKKLDRHTKQPISDTVFTRKFSLPYDVEYKDLKKIYSASGVIVIEANKK